MTYEEFSDQFDLLFNNIASNAAPGLNEYEKSVFLTNAQSEIVKNYFNPSGNKYREGFDGSAKRQSDFSMLMKEATLSKVSGSPSTFDPRATLYAFPSDMFIVVNEAVILKSSSTVKATRQVVPIAYNEYMRLMSKPYKEPLKSQAWRIITGQSDSVPTAELIINTNDSSYTAEYKLRYVRKPKPIILADLHSTVGDVSIDDNYLPQTSELDESLHREILQRAVELAKAAYATDQSGQVQLQNQMTIGQRSE